MHCIPHEKSWRVAHLRDQQKHLNVEYFFRWFHRFMVLLQAVLFGVELGFALYRSTNTFAQGLLATRFEAAGDIRSVGACSVLEQRDIGPFRDVPVNMSLGTQGMYVARLGYNVKLALGLQVAMVALSILNAALVEYRVYQLRLHLLVVRKVIFTAALLLVVALTLYAAITADGLAKPVKRYFDHCGIGGDGLHTYPPMVFTYVSCSVTLFILTCGALVNLRHLLVDGPLLTEPDGLGDAQAPNPLGDGPGDAARGGPAGDGFDGVAPAAYPAYDAHGDQYGDGYGDGSAEGWREPPHGAYDVSGAYEMPRSPLHRRHRE